jgi:hypothetical protein
VQVQREAFEEFIFYDGRVNKLLGRAGFLCIFGLESTLVGFLGIGVFLVPVTALLLTLRAY